MERTAPPKFNSTNIYRIRLFLCKLILKKHGDVHVEGMGECISLVFKSAQILSKNGLADIAQIKEENIESEGRKQINPKVTVILKKSANFDKMTEDLVLKE